MLTHLQIRNLAIIEELELEFKSGMSVFTGETGAGKSILIDALGLILGDRGDSTVIREKTEKSEIIASFDISRNPAVYNYLKEQLLTCDDNELIIRRIISKDGKSRAYINSSTVPVQVLRDLGVLLVNIHGQHAHQSLNHRNSQRKFLDSFAGHESILNQLATICEDWKKLNHQLSELSSDSGSYESTVELLEYQVNELNALNPGEGEYDALEEEYKRLSNVNDLIDVTQKAIQALSDDEHSADNAIQMVINDFRGLKKSDPKFDKLAATLENASILLSDAIDEIRNYAKHIEPDPERLSEVDKRINTLIDMARKHHVHARDLLIQLKKLESRLNDIKSGHDSINELMKQQENLLAKYKNVSQDLHNRRVKKAKTMSDAITKHLSGLGMPDGKFIIDIKTNDDDKPAMGGIDLVEFLVSLNPGSTPQPMRKIASGGELSRLSLAIQMVAKQSKLFPTLIFDEVDAGIGGKTADIVGKLLKDLAGSHQLFCVTHLPQVASRADNHFQVLKSSDKNKTYTLVKTLDEQERVEEIARMLGGMRISEKTRDHAREMLTQ